MVAASRFALRLFQRPPRQLIRLCSTSGNQPSPLSKKEQFKRAISQYGPTLIVFHVGISLASLGFFYALVSSGIDVISLVEKLPVIGEKVKENAVAAGATTFVIAYAVHKVFAPVRISITLGTVPFIVRYLRARGILKGK